VYLWVRGYLNSKKEKVKAEIDTIKEKISALNTFYTKVYKKIDKLYSIVNQNSLVEVENELKNIKEQSSMEFNNQRQEKLKQEIIIYKKYQEIPPLLSDSIHKWGNKLEKIENEINRSISEFENFYKKIRIPQLLKKLDLFIEQTTERLDQLLDGFKKESMNLLKDNFNQPEDTILELLNDQKKNISKEFNDKEEHIQLVFTRYNEYPLNEKKEQWNTQFKEIQNRYNDIITEISNFLEEKDKAIQALNKYYIMAKPVYGYKVPIKAISESLDIAADKLENLFVDLISNNFVSGEIDPVTKVIVLAPRAMAEKVVTTKSKQLRCIVCNLVINPSNEEVVYCSHCHSPAHRSHLIEWVKIKGFCPVCKKEIKIL